MLQPYGQQRQTGRAYSYLSFNIGTEQIVKQGRLGSGVDIVVNGERSLEASENFTSQWREGRQFIVVLQR